MHCDFDSKMSFVSSLLHQGLLNDPDQLGRYNQSSLALLLDLPPMQIVQHYPSITMWIAPAGTTDLDLSSFPDGRPTPENLKDLEWVKVKIGCAPEQIVVGCGDRIHAKRRQYALKHRGALTINKAQGYT